MARRSLVVLITTALTTLSTVAAMSQAGAEPIWNPTILHVGQINQQEIAPLPNSEPDTLVEPDIEASPTNPDWAVAATHEGRYPDGGAVDIAYAWTHDGGKTWHRASDPVVAWGPDGSVYLSILPVSVDCPSAVYVVRSTDGGETFGTPVLAHY